MSNRTTNRQDLKSAYWAAVKRYLSHLRLDMRHPCGCHARGPYVMEACTSRLHRSIIRREMGHTRVMYIETGIPSQTLSISSTAQPHCGPRYQEIASWGSWPMYEPPGTDLDGNAWCVYRAGKGDNLRIEGIPARCIVVAYFRVSNYIAGNVYVGYYIGPDYNVRPESHLMSPGEAQAKCKLLRHLARDKKSLFSRLPRELVLIILQLFRDIAMADITGRALC